MAANPHMLLLCSVVALLPTSLAWFDNGHLLVAEIAKQELGPEAAAQFDDVLGRWEVDLPGMSDLVNGAVWPDHIKCIFGSTICEKMPPSALEVFSSWHFADRPYNPDNLLLHGNPSAYFSQPSTPWVLVQAMTTFLYSKDPWAFNFMLRFVVHLIGDLHQPLHAMNGFFNNSVMGQMTSGDAGGNRFAIQTPPATSSFRPAINNLHFLWDATGGLYMDNWPYSALQSEALRSNATELRHEFPRISLGQYRSSDLDPCANAANPGTNPRDAFSSCLNVFKKWTDEVFDSYVTDVYGHGIQPHEMPSAEYVANVRTVSKHQITLAGYRLADYLRIVLPRLPAQSKQAPPTITLVETSFIQCVVPMLAAVILLLILKIRSLQAALKNRPLLLS